MKRILKSIFAIAAFAVALVSCKKPIDDPVPGPGPDPVEEGIEINQLFILGEATETGWSLDNMDAFVGDKNIWSWEGVLYANKDFRFPLQKTDFWPCLVKSTESDTCVALASSEDENNPFRVDQDGIYSITISSTSLAIIIELISPVLPEQDPITELYMLGDACDTGWSLDAMTAFENKGNGIFEWEGHLNAAGEFRFPLQKQSNVWWPCLVMGATEGTLAIGHGDDEKNQIPIDKDGIWHIKVDVNAMTYEMTLVKEDGPEEGGIEVSELYVLGDATDTGWDLGAMTAFENKGDGKFEWEGHLKPTGQFRFPLQKESNVWWPCLVKGAEEGTLALGKGDGDNNAFTVDTDGIWHINVDTKAMTYSMNYVGEYVPSGITITELYVLGSACDTGWDLGAMTAFVSQGNDIWVWEGHLIADGEFRFPLQKEANMWWPCLVMGAEEGKLAVGVGDSDNKPFHVSADGNWRITVDTKAMTYTMVQAN